VGNKSRFTRDGTKGPARVMSGRHAKIAFVSVDEEPMESQAVACIDQMQLRRKDWKRLASDLSQLGVMARGSIAPRGTASRSAAPRLPEGKLQKLLVFLAMSTEDERVAIVTALSEWGGEPVVDSLATMYNVEPDENVRLACALAIGVIGGQSGAEKLTEVARHDESQIVRLTALDALEELGAGGWTEVSDLHPPRSGNRQRLNRNAIKNLKAIREDPVANDLLRLRADQALQYFTDVLSRNGSQRKQ
jgi:HEAT repeat protein